VFFSLSKLAVFLSILLLALPASADDTAAVNRLFVDAISHWNAALALEEADDEQSVETLIGHLEAVHAALQSIVKDHSGSDLAVRLALGETVGPLSLKSAKDALDWARTVRCVMNPDRDCLFDFASAAARGERNAFAGRSLAVIAGRIESVASLYAIRTPGRDRRRLTL